VLSLRGTASPAIFRYYVRSGSQLKERVSELITNNPNVRAAVKDFEDRKLFGSYGELVEIKVRVNNGPGFSTLLFIPFAEPDPQLKHFVLLAETPKSSRFLMGTISTESRPPEVKDEKLVVDGKIEPGKGSLSNFLKCSVVACAPAGLGCLYGGPSWLPCFCLWCGGGLLTCGLLELLVP
jgi:hypothetical protein